MMKKLLVMLTLLIAGVLTMSAQHGYRGFADISLGAGITDTPGFSGSISTVHGYQLNTHIFLGGGLSLAYTSAQYYRAGYGNGKTSYGFLLPIFASFRYDYSLTSKHSFFYDVKIGYSVVKTGVFGSMGLGIRLGCAGRISYNLGMKFNVIQPHCGGQADWMGEPMVSFGIDF